MTMLRCAICGRREGCVHRGAGAVSDDERAAGVTFDELLEHLDDLIQLAANERYLYFASALDVVFVAAKLDQQAYAARADAPTTVETEPLRRST